MNLKQLLRASIAAAILLLPSISSRCQSSANDASDDGATIASPPQTGEAVDLSGKGVETLNTRVIRHHYAKKQTGNKKLTGNIAAFIDNTCVSVYQGPGTSFHKFPLRFPGSKVTITRHENGWARFRMPDGSIAWLPISKLKSVAATALHEIPATKPSEKPVNPTSAPTSVGALSGITQPPAKPNTLQPVNNTKNAEPTGSLAGTKPDPADRTQDNPMAAVGDPWRMIVYLFVILCLLYGVIRGLAYYYRKTGMVPSGKTGWIGRLVALSAKKDLPSNIRIIETVPVGAVSLILVDVRGKVLLLGATTGSVNLLSNLSEQSGNRGANFAGDLDSAIAELDPDSADTDDLPVLVGQLDDNIKEARAALERSAKKIGEKSPGGD